MSKKISIYWAVILLVVGLPGYAFADSGFVASGDSNDADGAGSFIGGGSYNATVGGGSFIGAGSNNVAGGPSAFVGAGWSNTSGGEFSFVGAGYSNMAVADYSFIGGGVSNAAGGQQSAIGGGYDNTAEADNSFIGGGLSNTASGMYSSVPGGQYNTAQGQQSFAGGYRAQANHDGAFVWADMTEASFASKAANQFLVRATGGVSFATDTVGNGVMLSPGSGSWATLSDKDSKENFEAVDGKAVLEKLASLPIPTWNYKAQSKGVRHMGPTAQDFSKAFGLGHDDKHIETVDTDGIALAAIKELTKELKEKDKQISMLAARLEKLETKARANR